MRKTLSIAVILLAFGVVSSANQGPVKVSINAAAKKLPAVPFAHEQHATRIKQCDKCHHSNKGLTAENAAKAKVEKCSVCHLDPKPNVPGMRDASPQKNPFHSLCMGCHKQQKKGPALCKDCHKK